MAQTTAETCGHFTDYASRTHCDVTTEKCYLIGWRCSDHSPASIAGHSECVPDPKLTLDGRRRAAGVDPNVSFTTANETVVDARAKASGKRRSNPGDFRAAQKAVNHG